MKRRSFLRNTVVLGIGANANIQNFFNLGNGTSVATGKRVGLIGLDTSHSMEFTKVLNANKDMPDYKGYQVVAAYPYGSRSIKTSVDKIASNITKLKEMGVQIVDSIEVLLTQVDCVLLETTDGHLHPEQAAQVFRTRKRVFIDKPLGAHLDDVQKVYSLAKQYSGSFFSSSALRYAKNVSEVRSEILYGKVLGADCFSPCTIEPTHEDLYWYGIHGVEMLFAIMGGGCRTVQAVHTPSSDIAVGTWSDGRVGVFRGMRTGVNAFGGTAFCEKSNIPIGDYNGYENLLHEIVAYFDSGIVPVAEKETKEIYAFMTAYGKSKAHDGAAISLLGF